MARGYVSVGRSGPRVGVAMNLGGIRRAFSNTPMWVWAVIAVMLLSQVGANHKDPLYKFTEQCKIDHSTQCG